MHPEFSDLEMYRRIATPVTEGTFWRDADWNTGPPFFQMFVVPVVWLYDYISSETSRLAIVLMINLGLAAAYVLVVLRGLGARGRLAILVFPLALICAAPYLEPNLSLQQINLLPALLCAIAFLRLGTHRDSPASGGLIGLAASIKVAPVLLLPYLWRRWRALGTAIAVGVTCALLPALVYGPRVLWDATTFWLFTATPRQSGAREYFNVSLPGLSHRIFDAHDRDLVAGVRTTLVDLGPGASEIIGALLGVAILAGLYVLIARGPARLPMIDLGILMPAASLAGTLAWRHHFVTLIPTYSALLVYFAASNGSNAHRRWAAILMTASLVGAVMQLMGSILWLEHAWLVANSFGMVTLSIYSAVFALLVAGSDPESDWALLHPPEELSPSSPISPAPLSSRSRESRDGVSLSRS